MCHDAETKELGTGIEAYLAAASVDLGLLDIEALSIMKLRAKSCSLLVVLSLFYVGVAGQSPTPDPQPPSGPQDADAPVNSEVLAAPVPSPSQVPSSLGEYFAEDLRMNSMSLCQ